MQKRRSLRPIPFMRLQSSTNVQVQHGTNDSRLPLASVKEPEINILLLSLIFPPDGVSSAQLLGEIVDDLSKDGAMEVTVVTTSPHYNVDEKAQALQPITWAWHRLYGKSDFNGASVWHVFMPKKAESSIMRAIQWLWFHLCSLVLAASLCRKADVVLTVSPPPTITVVATLLKVLFRKPFVYVMWELYPQILVTLGYLNKDSWLHRVLIKLEKFTYKKANRIIALHEPMRIAVGQRVANALEKTTVIPTFADVDFLKPMSSDTSLRRKYNLTEKFVVGYAGNLGPSEDLSIVLEAALQLPDVAFLICGDGTERKRLESYASENALKNVIFTGHLPYEMVPEITATADVSLVVLTEGVGEEALPSKVYKVMACGRPVLAVSGPQSPLSDLVTSLSVGRAVTDYSQNTLARAIEKMKAEPDHLVSMGVNARDAAIERFSRESVTRDYRELLLSVVHSK